VLNISPSRIRRYGRASALGLLTLCVLASALTATVPAGATQTGSVPVPVTEPLVTAAEFAKSTPVNVSHARLRATRAVVEHGAAVTLRGVVTATGTAMRGHVVRLQAHASGVWKTIRTKHLSARGTVAFTVTPAKTRSYRLAYPGRVNLTASVSRATRVVVKPAPPPPVVTASTGGGGGGAVASVANVSGARARVLAIAASLSGTPYSYGASGPGAFDCSGFTAYVFRKVGVSLPHNANAQLGRGVAVSRAQARPGDLVIFLDGGYGYHVGIYAGGSYMYDSPRPGLTVGKHQIYSSNVAFRRLL